MAQFFNFKGDYFGLTESDVQKNIDLYGYNIYTKKEQPRERFNPGKVILSPSALLMFIAGVLSFFSSGILTGINKPMAKYAGGISKSELKPTFVYSGTKILTGVAVCKVSATGVDTKYYHKVGEPTPKHCYYTTMERIIQKLLPLCSATAAVLALISMVAWILYGNEVFESAMRGITLGLCFLPAGMRP